MANRIDATTSSGPRLLDPDARAWEDLGVGGARAEIKPIVTPRESRTFGAGFARFERTRFDWRLTYDESIHVLDGALEVVHAGATVRASAGQVLFLPAGSDVTYVVPEACHLFYVAYPVDWQERLEAGDA